MEEDNILDKPIQESGIKHARLSFKMFLWAMFFFGLALFISRIPSLRVKESYSLLAGILLSLPSLSMMITGAGSFRHAVLSLRKQEPWVYQKVVGFLGGLVFVLLGLLVILNYILVYTKAYF